MNCTKQEINFALNIVWIGYCQGFTPAIAWFEQTAIRVQSSTICFDVEIGYRICRKITVGKWLFRLLFWPEKRESNYFTSKSATMQNSRKISNHHFLKYCKTNGSMQNYRWLKKVSFEWSHHSISWTDSVIESGSQKVRSENPLLWRLS